jgi:hypothetical protein
VPLRLRWRSVIWWRVLALDVLRLRVGKEAFKLSPRASFGVSRADAARRFMREACYRREPLAVSEHVVYHPWYDYIYNVEEPVEAELVRELYAYPFAAYERLIALPFKYRVILIDAQRREKVVEKAGARIETLCVRGPEPVARNGRVETELAVRGERLRFVRALFASAQDPLWLER